MAPNLLAHRAACDGLTQPFEQAFKTRQALADLRLALLHGSDAEKPAELDGHQHVVRDFPRPEAEIEEQRRQAAQYEDRDATTALTGTENRSLCQLRAGRKNKPAEKYYEWPDRHRYHRRHPRRSRW